MTSYYDEIELEDFDYDEESESYFYPCPCGDKFVITKQELIDGEDVATCPSCSLLLKVIYDLEDFQNTEAETITVTNSQSKTPVAVIGLPPLVKNL